MINGRICTSLAVVALISATPAFAQRVTFERTFGTTPQTTLDIATERGEVRVVGTDAETIVVRGTVTVKVGWDVPADAAELARRVAAAPPVSLEGETVRLRKPVGSNERRAVTVSFEVQLPRRVPLLVVSESGAIAVDGIEASVSVRTQSGAITLVSLGSTTDATTGSGAVEADRLSGSLRVKTTSGSISVDELRAGLSVHTNSGAVDGRLSGAGAVDVRTDSSAITLRGVTGSLTVSTGSGRARLSGAPTERWEISTGSGSVDVNLLPLTPVTIEAASGSGSVKVEGLQPTETVSKRRLVGTVAGGGSRLVVTSRSGSIRIGSRSES